MEVFATLGLVVVILTSSLGATTIYMLCRIGWSTLKQDANVKSIVELWK